MDKAYLKELLKDGKSYKEIGDIVGLHRNTVGYWAKKHEVSYLNINNKYSNTRKFKNSRLFKNIDSQERAYEDAEIYLQRKYEESMRILRHLE